MKIRRLSAVLGALALTFSAASTVLATAPVGHTVTICHANSDEKSPYVVETPDISQAGYNGDTSGHASHGGDGVWYPGAKGDHFNWGDIIPPYDYQPDAESPVFHYNGLNWPDGEAIWKNDCVAPAHDPSIHVEKTASDTTLGVGGGSVTYTYVVTNTGNVPLTDVTVSDNKCSPVTYSSGDTDGDNKLDLTESWTFTCTVTITETTTNVGTATGYDGEDKVSDTDEATVTVEQPVLAASIHVEKTVLPLTLPATGGDVTYTYVVSNTGDLPLTNVSVKDDNGTPLDPEDDFVVDCPKTALAVDESMTCTAAITGTTKTTTNIATASGTAGETTVNDTDDATVTVAAPGGGVQAETDVPGAVTAPPTDAIGGNAADTGNSLPILLIVLGIIGLAAVVLTPKRARR
jgi:uncharacterized repeat protein (TIGR01451 family)